MKKTILLNLIILISFSSFSMGTCPKTKNNELGIVRQQLTWQQHERSYWVHLPPKSKMLGPLPLLFHLHGGGGTGKGTVRLTDGSFNKIADREGFIAVYPDGIARSWNDGRTENLKPQNWGVDDVGFIAEIIKRLKQEYSIDSNRIFTVGMSNGGFMSSRLLCDRADLFRGGAVLTASLAVDYLPKCNPQRPVAVLVMNGTDDPIVPYDGGEIRLFKNGKSRGEIISNDEYIQFWYEKNKCTGQESTVELPDREKEDGTTVSITTYTSCATRGALKFYKIIGGGHTWPGGKQYLGKKLIGNTSREINAYEEIWEFFSSLD